MQDYEQLVERVVREVVGRLAAEGKIGGDTQCEICVACGQCAEKAPEAVQRIRDAGAARISSSPGIGSVSDGLAGLIDHTLLKPDARSADVERLCSEAVRFRFASVCVNPCWVKLAASSLEGSGVRTCSVVGFPLGAARKEIKAYEARRAVLDGAREIDMVMNIGALKSGDLNLVEDDMRYVREACGRGVVTKVILETALLTDSEKITACRIAGRVGMDFVKTSTGFGPGGATAEDVELMRRTVGATMGVKASGGIRDQETAERMIEAGATRIGASASVKIVGGGE
jgi:deoxyribose-phosphate aldolase